MFPSGVYRRRPVNDYFEKTNGITIYVKRESRERRADAFVVQVYSVFGFRKGSAKGEAVRLFSLCGAFRFSDGSSKGTKQKTIIQRRV